MPSRPYDRTRREGRALTFVADLPAFAAIGRRYDAVLDAYVNFRYSPAYVQGWRDFAQALQTAVGRTLNENADWSQADADLARRFPDKYPQLRDAMPTLMVQRKDTPAGLRDYLQFMVARANMAQAVRGSHEAADDLPGTPPAPPDLSGVVQAMQNLTQTYLQSSPMQKRMDEMRQNEPGLYALTQEVLAHLGRDDAASVDPAAAWKNIQERAAARSGVPLKPDPFVEQAQKREEMLRAQEAERARQQPQAAAAEEKKLPPGRFRFDCGRQKAPTAGQKELFDWLEKNQAMVVEQVKDAVRNMYGRMAAGANREDPQEQVLFPKDASADVALDRFRITSFYLHPKGRRIGVTFDTLFGHFDEHGCGLVIADREVADYGEAEVLFALYEDEGR